MPGKKCPGISQDQQLVPTSVPAGQANDGQPAEVGAVHKAGFTVSGGGQPLGSIVSVAPQLVYSAVIVVQMQGWTE